MQYPDQILNWFGQDSGKELDYLSYYENCTRLTLRGMFNYYINILNIILRFIMTINI
jgi:hypothetical protein